MNHQHTMAAILVLTGALMGDLIAQDAVGSVLFSKSPINIEEPADLVTSFAAGDEIYALMQFSKPLSDILGRKDKLMLRLEVDGDAVFYQYLSFKNDVGKARSHIVVDIAPDPEKMTAYRDPAYSWGTGKQSKKLGPHGFSWSLGQLAAGKHTVKLCDFDFGRSRSLGEFTIEGDDYSSYTALSDRIEEAMNQVATLPPAKMTSDELEGKMRTLLESAGWKDILKLNIVDKDWWIDRVAGGNSPVASRHMAAAAAYRDSGGLYFYKTCTFHEHMLITGGFGPLTLTHEGQPIQISEESLGMEKAADEGPDLSEVAEDDQPDFSKPEEVLADVERIRKEAMKSKNFALVGRCGTAASKIKRAVEKDPQGYEPEVKRLWLEIYEASKKGS